LLGAGAPINVDALGISGGRFTIALNGNAGIGDNNPAGKLTVSGSESSGSGFGAAVKLSNSAAGGANWYLRAGATGTNTPAGGFSIANDSLYAISIQGNGQVGIGTVTPQAALDVRGNVAIGGDTPMSSNPHMSFSGMFLGSFCMGYLQCGGTDGFPMGGFVPDKNILITRMTITMWNPIDPSCLPANAYLSNATTFVVTVPLQSASVVDSGPLKVSIPAGTQLTFSAGVAHTHCNVGASAGGNAFMNAQYVMQ
jgi:hypothetical protein